MADTEELKEQQRRQWSGNAARWDLQHDQRERESRAVTDWLCREAGIAPGMHVLDLACGSGHPSLTIAGILGAQGKLVATDLVPDMAAVTRRRLQEAGFGNAEVRVMDAEAIDLPDASFDAVTCRFGMMFCPRPDVAMAGVHRVLKAGGRFALCVWAEPEKSPGQTAGGEALRRFGRPPAPVNFDAPGIYQLAPPGKLQKLLAGAGFRDVRAEPVGIVSEYASLDAFLSPNSTRSGAVRNVMAELEPAEAERLKSILTEVLAPYTGPGGTIRLPMTPLCAVATK